MKLFACFMLAAVPASGHMSLIVPPSRNAIDKSLAPWANGTFGPAPGETDKYGCNCVNASAPCEVAQSCFWFSGGCGIGCKECDGKGANPSTHDRCNSGMKATVNDPYRTFNLESIPLSEDDYYRWNPWRAPGAAPVYDSCGMAGGQPIRGGGEAKYTNTSFARQGQLGSKVLPPAPSGTVWKAGEEVEARWSVRANHGGGYQYRLCSASKPLNEACFSAMPVPFTGKMVLEWFNGTRLDISSKAMYVSVGTLPKGSAWARNPLPYSNPGGGPDGAKPQFEPPCPETKLDRDGVPTSPTGDCSGQQPYNVTIVDALRVPADVPKGDYVLQLRYDCEKSAQVWTNCADLEIV